MLADIREQLLLPWLPEGQPIRAQGLHEAAVVLSSTAHRQQRHEPLDGRVPGVDPVREDLGAVTALRRGQLE
ncbi:hypothetical protein [Ornithinimicrobium kibberense]|uniref:hypothetical protein n=1 Tax=Ornithinimicrobium kibberense TaxID=282060 RepID=UPI00360B4566